MAKRQSYIRGVHTIAKNAYAGTGAGWHKKRQSIGAADVRTFGDTGQTQAHVEWEDGSQTVGSPDNPHMLALLARSKRDGVKVRYGEVW